MNPVEEFRTAAKKLQEHEEFTARWIALVFPGLTEPLTAVFEAVANAWEGSTGQGVRCTDTGVGGHLLAAARVINGGDPNAS